MDAGLVAADQEQPRCQLPAVNGRLGCENLDPCCDHGAALVTRVLIPPRHLCNMLGSACSGLFEEAAMPEASNVNYDAYSATLSIMA